MWAAASLGQVVLGCINKPCKLEPASKQDSSIISASSSYLSSLPLLLSMEGCDVGGAVIVFRYGLQTPGSNR